MKLRLLPISAILFSCATAPKYSSEKDQGKWEAKAQIKNLKNGETQTVGLDFVSTWPDRMRMEVTGPLGVALASAVVSDSQIKYVLHKQKRYYEGPLSNKVLYPIFQLHLNPSILMNILFDRAPSDAEFVCEKGTDGMLQRCLRSTGVPLTVEWKDRKEELKRVSISGTDFELNIAFKSFSPKVEVKPGLWDLNAPSSFKKYKLK